MAGPVFKAGGRKSKAESHTDIMMIKVIMIMMMLQVDLKATKF
jgi:hypothetical protein